MWWDTDLVAKIVGEHVKKWKIDSIITFDDGGVSGHINHRAVAAGVKYPPTTSPAPSINTTYLEHHISRTIDLVFALFSAEGNSRHLALETPSLAAYQLTTIFLLRKYTILLDLPFVLFLSLPRLLKTTIWGDEIGSWGLMVANPGMYFTGRHAFERHASQVVWDRYHPPPSIPTGFGPVMCERSFADGGFGGDCVADL